MLNECSFIGNVAADPEIKSFDSGDKVANFTLAVAEKWKDKNGDKREKVEWVKISCTNQGLLKVIERYVRKGSKLFVQGKIETRKWEQDGQIRYATEVVLRPYNGKVILLGGKPDSSSGSQPSQHNQAKQNGFQPDANGDEIPF